MERKGVLDTTHEILERLEAHLRAVGQFTVCLYIYFLFTPEFWNFNESPHFWSQVVANMRGNSIEEVAERVLSQPSLSGLQVRF